MALNFFSILSSTIFLSIFAIVISLNFRISKFLNLSHGSIFALGAYVAYYTIKSGIVMGMFLAAVLAFFTGVILYLLIKKIGNGIFEATIISLGFAIGLEEILRIAHGKGYYLIVESNLMFAGIDFWEIMQGLMLLIILIALFVVYKSKTGIKLKFVEDDEFLARIYGVDYEKFSLFCIALTSSAIGLLGFLSSTSQALYPGIGWMPLIAGILIAAITALFRSIGLAHYTKIVLIAFVYSLIVSIFLS